MAYSPITYVDITPATTDAWTDIDISAYVSANAKGVAIYAKTSNESVGLALGLRMNGSTDDRTTVLPTTGATDKGHTMAYIGLDENQIFEAYLGYSATWKITLVLVGEFGSESEWFANAYDESLGATGTTVDIDIAAETDTDTAIGAIWEINEVSGASAFYDFYLREKGSTDNFYFGTSGHFSFGFICPVDASEICEGKIETTNIDFYLVGYIKSSILFYTNAVDISLSATTTWTDITLPNSNIGGLIEVVGNNSGWDVFGFRKNGYVGYLLNKFGNRSHSLFVIDTDASKILEGYIEDTSTDFYLRGEFGYFIDGTGIYINVDDEWLEIISSESVVSGYLKSDGSVPLTADWDAGGYEIRALTFESDVATGTAPLTIASTTLVSNLNADLLDGQEGSYYAVASNVLLKDGSVALTADWDAGGYEIRALTFESDVATGTAPLTIASTTLVSNLNADYVDSIHGTDLLKKDGTVALTGDWDIGDGRMIKADKIQARDGDGLALYEDGGLGIFIQDGGNIGIGTTTPSDKLTLYSSTASVRGVFETAYASGNAGFIVKNPAGRNGEIQFWDAGSRQWSFGAISDDFAIQKYSGSWSTKFYIDFTTEQTYALKGLYVGDGTAGTDFTLTFDGETNDGVLTWMEDEDYFKFSDDILMNSTERVYFRDTGISIFSQADSYMNLVADGAVRIGDATPTNYVQIGATGNLSFVGSAGFYPRRISQSAEPANGTGDTQIDVGELIIWRDPDDNKTYLVYNDTDEGVRTVELI